ncbi:hypothetical protein DDE20_16315 [Pararhodobacter oceanensis]|uniref:Uncharacterized protein n=1 Tax=Pararhodobacter oceanensis TaxID=2172121 RepID=A0A2T8HQH6_9RHOB|nr:hypothetical protein DDE20_16315 [Pararhodobacter oceanensis]
MFFAPSTSSKMPTGHGFLPVAGASAVPSVRKPADAGGALRSHDQLTARAVNGEGKAQYVFNRLRHLPRIGENI